MAQASTTKEYETLKEDLAKLRSDMEALLKTVAADQRQGAKEGVARAKAAGDAALGQARDKAKESIEAVEQNVQRHPFISLLAAFGVGMLLAQLIVRR